MIDFDNRCAYCGGGGFTVDHLIAQVKGGHDVIENIVPACGSCNSSKCDSTGSEFIARRLENGFRVPTKSVERIASMEASYRALYGNLSADEIISIKKPVADALVRPTIGREYTYHPVPAAATNYHGELIPTPAFLVAGVRVTVIGFPSPLHNYCCDIKSSAECQTGCVLWASLRQE